jgi:hypothetical protein
MQRIPRLLNRHVDIIPPGAVYIGRPSRYANPFRIGIDGNREEVIRKFESYAIKRTEEEPGWLDPLHGKDLVCSCYPLPCHGDIVIRLANPEIQFTNERKEL